MKTDNTNHLKVNPKRRNFFMSLIGIAISSFGIYSLLPRLNRAKNPQEPHKNANLVIINPLAISRKKDKTG